MISDETRQALTECAEALDEALKRVHVIDAAQRRTEGQPDQPETGRELLRTLHKDIGIDKRMELIKGLFRSEIEDPDLNEIQRCVETALFFIRDILEHGN
jgi:hypothetical protein